MEVRRVLNSPNLAEWFEVKLGANFKVVSGPVLTQHGTMTGPLIKRRGEWFSSPVAGIWQNSVYVYRKEWTADIQSTLLEYERLFGKGVELHIVEDWRSL